MILPAALARASSPKPRGKAGEASWYSSDDACGRRTNRHPGCPTASGRGLFQLERSSALFAAVNGVPLGKRVRFTNVRNGRSVEVTVLDRGSFDSKYGRIADLGKVAFSRIADPGQGIAKVRMEVL